MRNTYLAVGIIVVIVIFVAFAFVRTRLPQIGQFGKGEPSPTPQAMAKESVSASKHTPASTAVVDSVVLTDAGFAVIHEDQNGEPGQILGASSLLTAGRHENVVIALSRKTVDGERLYVMLHKDNGNGTFEATGDEPVKDEGGSVVHAQFEVSSEAGGFQIPATGLGEDDN